MFKSSNYHLMMILEISSTALSISSIYGKYKDIIIASVKFNHAMTDL